MFSRITNLLAPGPRHPSVVLILQKDPKNFDILHVVPEDGTVERVGYALPEARKFDIGGCREVTREQLGTVSFLPGSYDQLSRFLDEVRDHATESLSRRPRTGVAEANADYTEQALRSAVSASLEKWEGRKLSFDKAQPHEIILVHIERREPGTLRNANEPRSIARW